MNPECRGFGGRGLQQQKTQSRVFRDPRSPEVDVAEWDPGAVVESRWRARSISEFGTREVERLGFVARVDIPQG
jgi:hypothetical protein